MDQIDVEKMFDFDPWLNCEHRNRFGFQGTEIFPLQTNIGQFFCGVVCVLIWMLIPWDTDKWKMIAPRWARIYISYVTNGIFINLALSVLCQQHTIWIYCCQQLLSRSYVDFEWNSTQIIFANWIEMCTDSVLQKLYVFFFLFVASYFISFFLFSSLVCHFNVTSTHLLVFNASAEQIKQTPEMFVACFGLFLYNFHSFLSNFIWIHFYSVKFIWFIQMCRLQFAFGSYFDWDPIEISFLRNKVSVENWNRCSEILFFGCDRHCFRARRLCEPIEYLIWSLLFLFLNCFFNYLGIVTHLVYEFCVEIAFSSSSSALDFFNFFTRLLTAFSDHLPSIDESSFPFFHANKRFTIGGVNGNILKRMIV